MIVVAVYHARPDGRGIKVIGAVGIKVLFIRTTSHVGSTKRLVIAGPKTQTHVTSLTTPHVTYGRIAAGDIVAWKLFDGGRGLSITGAVADIRVEAVDGPAEVARKQR